MRGLKEENIEKLLCKNLIKGITVMIKDMVTCRELIAVVIKAMMALKLNPLKLRA